MKYPEIEVGALLANRIKVSLYPNAVWSKVVMRIAEDMNELKKIAQVFYPKAASIELMNILNGYGVKDWEEALGIMTNAKEAKICKEGLGEARSISGLLESSMAAKLSWGQ